MREESPVPTLEFHLENTEGTARFGALLAGLLQPGDVVLLVGELGAGKTTLVRAVASSLGIEPAAVSSPTFTLMHEYVAPGGAVIVHADAYRLRGDDEAELELLGWDQTGDAVVLVEWGDRIGSLIERPKATLELRHEGEQARSGRLEAPDSWADRRGWAPMVEAFGGFPFDSARAQWADLYRWFNGTYRLSRPMEEADLDGD